MSGNESEDFIRYDILTQDALRGVISKVLEEVSSAGLPGDHHFFITFETTFAGVQLSPRMRERYPKEMTIVIQHSFWSLTVKETLFEIDLSFDDIRERLRIPFAAVKGFYDPSVKFGLQFDVEVAASEQDNNGDEPEIAIGLVDDGASEGTAISNSAVTGKKDSEEAAVANGDDATSSDDADDSDNDGGADVVLLDSFRNKNK